MVTLHRFSGDNPAAWVLKAEQYFTFYNIFPEYKLSFASLYLDGEALDWYCWLFRNKQLGGWDHFVEKLFLRFCNCTSAEDGSREKLIEIGFAILHQLEDLRDALSACATKLATRESSIVDPSLEDQCDSKFPVQVSSPIVAETATMEVADSVSHHAAKTEALVFDELPQHQCCYTTELNDEQSVVPTLPFVMEINSDDGNLDENGTAQQAISRELTPITINAPIAELVVSNAVVVPSITPLVFGENCINTLAGKVFDIYSQGEEQPLVEQEVIKLPWEISDISVLKGTRLMLMNIFTQLPFDPGKFVPPSIMFNSINVHLDISQCLVCLVPFGSANYHDSVVANLHGLCTLGTVVQSFTIFNDFDRRLDKKFAPQVFAQLLVSKIFISHQIIVWLQHAFGLPSWVDNGQTGITHLPWDCGGHIDAQSCTVDQAISIMENSGTAKASSSAICILVCRQLNDCLNQFYIDKEVSMRIHDLMTIEGFVRQNVSSNFLQANIVAMEFYILCKSCPAMVLADLRDAIGKFEFYFGINSNDQLLLTKFPFDPGDDLRLTTCGLSLALGEWDLGIYSETLLLKGHIEYKHTLLLLEFNGKFCSIVSSDSMTKVWDPGRQWCRHSYIFLCDFPLVVSACSAFSYFYIQLEQHTLNKGRQKKILSGLFVYPLRWMDLAHDFEWHVLLDAFALEPNDTTHALLLNLFHASWSIFHEEASNRGVLQVQSLEAEFIKCFWSSWKWRTKPHPATGPDGIMQALYPLLPLISDYHVNPFTHMVNQEQVVCKVAADEHDICGLLCFCLLLLTVVTRTYQQCQELTMCTMCSGKIVEYGDQVVFFYANILGVILPYLCAAKVHWELVVYARIAENYCGWLLIELWIYWLLCARLQSCHNIGSPYFGSFKMVKLENIVPNILALLNAAQLYHVFHISMLKSCNGSLNHPTVLLQNQQITPLQNLEDKVLNTGEGNVVNMDSADNAYGPVIWTADDRTIGPGAKSQRSQTIRQPNKIFVWDPGGLRDIRVVFYYSRAYANCENAYGKSASHPLFF